jgi:hypothetical protein
MPIEKFAIKNFKKTNFVIFSWDEIPSMDVGRAYASATTDKNDNLWITGGQVKS